jgi:hypothetical protein
MTVTRIHVISPRTWGEFGNFLAATRFTRAVRERFADAEVTTYEAEPMVPWLGEVGRQIRTITLDSPDTATRTGRYLRLMDDIARRYPAGFEVAEPDEPTRRTLTGLVAHLDTHRPDLVVGTKGFVSRLCLAAARRSGHPVPVVSHVTNPGLLSLPIHRSAHLDATLVGFEWAKRDLLAHEGGAAERVHVVGPLVAQHDLHGFLTGPDAAGPPDEADQAPVWPSEHTDRPRIILFSNRGGEDYLTILRHLARRHPDVDLVFVGYQDLDLVGRASQVSAPGERVPRRWRFHSRLTQRQYFGYIDGAARAEHAFLVSKAGPNTTLEAAYFGIPVLMLESGLPMESWVADLIHEHELGRCTREVDQLVDTLDAWLADPALITAHKRACMRYARDNLDQAAVSRRIETALRTVLDLRPMGVEHVAR